MHHTGRNRNLHTAGNFGTFVGNAHGRGFLEPNIIGGSAVILGPLERNGAGSWPGPFQ